MAKKPPVAKVQKETTATTSNNTTEEVTTIPAATFDIQEQINAAFSNATKTVAVEVSETADAMDESMLPYLDAYPNVDTFYRTTDGQVFLNDNLAVLHQRTLTGDNKFKTFKR